MALRYVLDEHHRGILWRTLQRHNARGRHPLDVVRVGDFEDLPLSVSDSDILLWAERENRIFISQDQRTLPKHLAAHTAAGHRCPGIFLVRSVRMIGIVDFLVCAAYASEEWEWENQIVFIP